MSPVRFAPAVLWLAAVSPPAPAAGVKLAPVFGDHMVIQRDRPIHVRGEAAPGATVDVSLGDRRGTATAGADGRWAAELAPLPGGGPYTLTAAAAGSAAAARDVLVGDVWLCSGQSNMQMPLSESEGGNAAAEARLPLLRLCTVGKASSNTPRTAADVRWAAATPAAARDFSAVGYYFAARLLADPALGGVPLGVIDSSFGGTTCEGWVPREALAGLDPRDLRDSMFGIKPSGLYNAMIAPLGRFPVKGVVWYQGEANAGRPGSYPGILAAMAAAWRRQFDTPGLPFVIVQLPDYAGGADGLSWAWFREAQAKAARDIPHASLAVGINSNDGFDLHPKPKADLGRRAALLALHDVYRRPVVARGPVFREARRDGAGMRVAFDTAGDGLAARGGSVRGFAVAGADGKYFYADAGIDGDAVVLRSGRVPEPKTVRYAWSGVPDATLTNRSGLPAGPFRTDSLPPPDVDVLKQPAARHLRTGVYEATVDGTGSVTSLGVGGRQFVSNGLGGGGGTSVPGWFGPRALADVRDLGPGLVSCSDGQFTLQLQFGEAGMDWTLTNRGRDAAKFRVVLAPQVAVAGRGAAGPLTLTRGPATATVTGIDTVTDSEDGCVLETAVPGHGVKRVGFGFKAR